MTDRIWYSRAQGDATPVIHMEIQGNASYRQTFEFHEIDANNADVSGGERDFTAWDADEFRLVFSATLGGAAISGATLTGTDIKVSGDPTGGLLLVRATTTQTAALETHLEAAGKVSRGAVYGRLYGVDGNGDTITLANAHVRVQFGSVAA